jgi:hypothetical protein
MLYSKIKNINMKKICKLLITIIFLTANSNSFGQLISASYGFAQTGPIPKGTIDAPILKLTISVGSGSIVLDSMTWNINGCTNYVSDVNVFSTKTYYTDTNNYFSTSFPSFIVSLQSSPSTFVFPVNLHQGDNYLWLTYDVKNTATTGNCLGAMIDSLYFEGIAAVNPVFIPDSFSCIEIGNAQTSAIKNLSNTLSQINLYPNPTNGILKMNIPLINNEAILFKISDCMGHIIFQKSNEYSKQMEYDLSSIANGIYVAEIIYDGKSCFSKLIKE